MIIVLVSRNHHLLLTQCILSSFCYYYYYHSCHDFAPGAIIKTSGRVSLAIQLKLRIAWICLPNVVANYLQSIIVRPLLTHLIQIVYHVMQILSWYCSLLNLWLCISSIVKISNHFFPGFSTLSMQVRRYTWHFMTFSASCWWETSTFVTLFLNQREWHESGTNVFLWWYKEMIM